MSVTISTSSVTPAYGGAFTLSILDEPSSEAPTYQWYKNGFAINDATESTYIVNGATKFDSGDYYLFWRDSPSNSVTIAVSERTLAFTVSPAMPPIGGSATLTVTSPLEGAAYQLYRNGGFIETITGSSYTLTAFASGEYHIVELYKGDMTVGYGVTITGISPPIITVQPVDSSMIIGSAPPTLFVSATNSPTYQWYRGTGSFIAGATNRTYTPIINSAGSYSYYVVVSNAAGSVQSDTVTVTATAPPLPIIITQPIGGYMFPGVTTYTLSVVASAATSYRWYTGDGRAISGATSSSYRVESATPASLSFYVVVTSDAGSITSATVAVVALTPDTPLTITPNNFERLNFSTTTATPIKSLNDRDYSAIATLVSSGSATINTPPFAITYSNIPAPVIVVQAAVSAPLRTSSGKITMYINTVMKDVNRNIVNDLSSSGGVTLSFLCPPVFLDEEGVPTFSLYEIDNVKNLPSHIPMSYDPATGLLTARLQYC